MSESPKSAESADTAAALASDNGPIFDEQSLPRAHGLALGRGRIRESLSDFRVEEELGFSPSGEGEHALMFVEKRGANTNWVAGQLARHAGVRSNDIGYAGLKDRHAVTRQWFSVPLAEGMDPESWPLEDARIIQWGRHRKKLRSGTLKGNRFSLVVRGFDVDSAVLDQRLARIASLGVPNYFGPQRFGRAGDNVARLLKGKLPRKQPLRGILLSAGRAWLFNAILAARVEAGDWHQPRLGDLMLLDGSRSHFLAEDDDPALPDRCRRGDIHPSGALWGAGPSPAAGAVADLENAVADQWPEIVERLGRVRMDHDRRALRLPVQKLNWTQDGDSLRLSFYLSAGGFATTVLREILHLEEADHD